MFVIPFYRVSSINTPDNIISLYFNTTKREFKGVALKKSHFCIKKRRRLGGSSIFLKKNAVQTCLREWPPLETSSFSACFLPLHLPLKS